MEHTEEKVATGVADASSKGSEEPAMEMSMWGKSL